MTFVIASLLGSLFGACVGFVTAGAVRARKFADDAEGALAVERCYLGNLPGDATMQMEGGVAPDRRALCTVNLQQLREPVC